MKHVGNLRENENGVVGSVRLWLDNGGKEIDITEMIGAGKYNMIVVRVSNTLDGIKEYRKI